jgi:uncharacterized protein YjiS (DUF1127 family)
MTCMSCTRPAVEAGRPTRWLTLSRAAGLIRWAWRTYWDWRARKVTMLLLRSLDRRTLHDIGIAPSEIESLVCSCAHDGRRRHYDASWFWRSDAR